MIELGIIGFGYRAGEILDSFFLLKDVDVVAVCDPNYAYAEKYITEKGKDWSSIKKFDNPDKMLDSVHLDGVIIATRCSLHTTMAIKVLKRRIPLFLEKPVATNIEDLKQLKEESKGKEDKVTVSFPLRLSPLCLKVKEIIDSSMIGEISQVQAYNNINYGGVYYHNWYRDASETGGLFLQKATHDFDYINFLVGKKPIKVCAVTSRQYYKGNKPDNLKCIECSEYESCIESPYVLRTFCEEEVRGEMCCFNQNSVNEDSSSAIIIYENGMHASYTQNFHVKKGAGRRGATLIGTKGTLEFDWTTNKIEVFMHYTPDTMTYHVEVNPIGHSGGDLKLARDFIEVIKGNQSQAGLQAGIESTLMCIKAKESAKTHQFMEIKW